MLYPRPPLIRPHSFFSGPSKDLPWPRIGTPSSHSGASANPRRGNASCPSKKTTPIFGSTPPPISSFNRLRTPYFIVRRGQTVLLLTSSEGPVSHLNDRILVCPAIGSKAGLTVIFNKVRTRCVQYRGSPLGSAPSLFTRLNSWPRQHRYPTL